jgi:hypothetical protein
VDRAVCVSCCHWSGNTLGSQHHHQNKGGGNTTCAPQAQEEGRATCSFPGFGSPSSKHGHVYCGEEDARQSFHSALSTILWKSPAASFSSVSVAPPTKVPGDGGVESSQRWWVVVALDTTCPRNRVRAGGAFTRIAKHRGSPRLSLLAACCLLLAGRKKLGHATNQPTGACSGGFGHVTESQRRTRRVTCDRHVTRVM